MKNYIDLASIVLPALILLMGIIRVFVKKTRGINGLTFFFAVLLLLAGLIDYYVFTKKSSSPCDCDDNKSTPLAVSKHSAAFNQSAENVLTAYYKLTDAFTAGDTTAISRASTAVRAALDSFRIDELKVDTLIYQTAVQPFENAKAEVASIATDPSLAEKRGSLNLFSYELYTLLNTVRYDLAKLYWQECDRAFGEGKPGNWISAKEVSTSPYEVKDCAEVRTSINFVPADTTKKL
jgi:hypothetical protein